MLAAAVVEATRALPAADLFSRVKHPDMPRQGVIAAEFVVVCDVGGRCNSVAS